MTAITGHIEDESLKTTQAQWNLLQQRNSMVTLQWQTVHQYASTRKVVCDLDRSTHDFQNVILSSGPEACSVVKLLA